MTPSEKHMETAKQVYADSPVKVIGELEAGALVRHIAAALAQAERKGMKRAEAVCYARADEHMAASRQYTPDADEDSHLACLECALEANRCGAEIRAETGEGA